MAIEGIDLGIRPEVGSVGKKVIHQLPKNPRDKTTIVSVYPREIVDIKPTLFPGRFVIPAAPDNDFSLLVLESSSYYQASRIEKQPPNEFQVLSNVLAESIIKDSIPTMNLVSANARPGVFHIPGAYDKISILKYVDDYTGKTFEQLLTNARTQQRAYFTLVIDEADYFWAKTNGDPRSIPADAKLAVRIFGLEKSKPWMSNHIAADNSPCPACGEMINKIYPVCKFCHNVIDKEKAKELDLVFAKS